jgi:GNAT superfamily N-acetyltransferase
MHINILIKPAKTEGDFLDVILLKNTDDSEGTKFPISESITKTNVQILRDSGYTFLIAKQENKAIGYAMGIRDEDKLYRSKCIYVLPEFRNEGIGLSLKKAQLNLARKEGCIRIRSHLTKKDVYCGYIHRKLGFKIRPNETGYVATLYLRAKI